MPASNSNSSTHRSNLGGLLSPKREQCKEALQYINILLDNCEADETLVEQAHRYRMSFGPRRNRPLGPMRGETLRRLKSLAERDLERADDYDELRSAAQNYLRFTPPGFPCIHSDGLSPARSRELHLAHTVALEDLGALPDIENEDYWSEGLTAKEKALFAKLQQRAYADTRISTYVPLRWNRADGCIRRRECALVYDPAKGSYLFLAHILADGSRHRRKLDVKGQLFDVNNPTVKLSSGQKPSCAMLFELEFNQHQRRILDQAREDTHLWKSNGKSSAGSVRSATLHAHYSHERRSWWFEVQLSIGIKPSHIVQPLHVVGVHVDPFQGWFVSVLDLAGVPCAQFRLDEYTIATWLLNQSPDQQARIPYQKRTAKERHHRMADALVGICQHYQAQLGIENIRYWSTAPNPVQQQANGQSASAITQLIQYKLARANLPRCKDVTNIAPKRDCSGCGQRHARSQVQSSQFCCPMCGHTEDRYLNTSREVARQVLWVLARKTAPRNDVTSRVVVAV